MPLSKEKRQELLKELGDGLGPMIKEAVEETAPEVVQREVEKHLQPAKEENERYSKEILSQRDRDKVMEMEHTPGKGGIGVARIARCMALGNNDPGTAASIADKTFDDDLGKAVTKVLSSGDTDEGGVFVPQEMAETFIDALRARAVVRQAGPRTLDLSGGNLRVPRVTTDPTAGWVGEGSARNASNMSTGSLNFTAKTLQGKTSITQELLRRSGQNAEQIVRDNLIDVMANEEDTAFFRGTGSENMPRGMLNWAPDSSRFDANSTVNLTNVQDDLRQLISNLTDNDVDISQAAMFMPWRLRNFLAFKIRDQEDRPAFKEELTNDPPTVNGLRAWVTNNIRTDLGGSNNEGRIYAAAMDQAWLAEEQGLRIRASNEATFTDETGNTVSAFDRGLMVIIMERDLDFAMAHPEAVSVMEGVTWGA